MTIEHIMLLASVAQTPRDWAEVRAAILALLDAEAEACAEACEDFDACSPQYIARAIRARIAERKGGNDD
jgi:hypothetical protein